MINTTFTRDPDLGECLTSPLDGKLYPGFICDEEDFMQFFLNPDGTMWDGVDKYLHYSEKVADNRVAVLFNDPAFADSVWDDLGK